LPGSKRMINIRAFIRKDGCLGGLTAEGHALKASPGYSPVCAGVTTLLRTGGELLEAEEDIKAEISAPSEGTLRVLIGRVPGQKLERVRAITDFLLYGLQQLCQDAPEEIEVSIEEREE